MIVINAYIQGVPKVRLHLSYGNKTQQISSFFLYFMSMCSPLNAAHFGSRFGVPDTRRFSVADGTFSPAVFSRSVSRWGLVHGSSLPSFCWIIPRRFSSRFGSGDLPGHTGFSQNAARLSAPFLGHFLGVCSRPILHRNGRRHLGRHFPFQNAAIHRRVARRRGRVFVTISLTCWSVLTVCFCRFTCSSVSH